MIDEHENLLRTVRFKRTDYIPMGFHINSACWHHYPPDALGELMAGHPMLFPDAHFVAALGENGYNGKGCFVQRAARSRIRDTRDICVTLLRQNE